MKQWCEILLFFIVASLSEGQLNKQSDGDVKECDHLKKVPISGYINDTSTLKPSRNNYTYFNFKFQSANGFCDGVCFEKSPYNCRDILVVLCDIL